MLAGLVAVSYELTPRRATCPHTDICLKPELREHLSSNVTGDKRNGKASLKLAGGEVIKKRLSDDALEALTIYFRGQSWGTRGQEEFQWMLIESDVGLDGRQPPLPL